VSVNLPSFSAREDSIALRTLRNRENRGRMSNFSEIVCSLRASLGLRR
jgi:hypothetical protein